MLKPSITPVKIVIAIVAAAVWAAGLRWGTFAVGGSDSYCYVHQADGWATGRLQVVEPLALEAPWPNPSLTFAPSGHIPSPTVRGAAVPICPAGLSIVMAPFVGLGHAVGRPSLVFVVVPLFGALLICSVYVLGTRLSPRVGVASALLVACSPAFLFQLMQPMSDVPAAALWLLATACATSSGRRAPLWAGLATSAAIVIRPNLLPLGLVLGVQFLRRVKAESESGDEPSREVESSRQRTPTPFVRAGTFALACAPGCVAVALIQQMFYGSPFSSGYGSLAGLFAVDHIVPNAIRYARWMSQSHTPIWLIALAAPFVLPHRFTALLWSIVVVNVLCYLPYVVFNDWWYLRFVLPAIAIVLLLTLATIDALFARRREAGVVVVTMVLCAVFVREARALSVFDLPRLEARYQHAGAYVDAHLPQNALIITSWESGSVRYYGRRKTLVWDVLDPMWLDRAIAYSRARGFEPYLLFEAWEEPLFRQRFAASTVARLDWPPMAEIGGQVRIYRPDDRDRYLKGEAAPTEYAR